MKIKMKKKGVLPLLLILLFMACSIQVGAAGPEDLILFQIYGTGLNGDTPVGNSFIELYNTASAPVTMTGMAIQYASKPGEAYRVFPLKDGVVIPAKSSYLIKCAPAVDSTGSPYDSTYEQLRISAYDEYWPSLQIDNKSAKLALTSNKAPVIPGAGGTDSSVSRQRNVIDFAGLGPDADDFKGTKSEAKISKQKSARRTAKKKDAPFELIAYQNAKNSYVSTYRPWCSRGDLNTWKHGDDAVPDVNFSKKAGFYPQEFSLSLSVPAGFQIYYTVNGESPSAVSGQLYTEPIPIKKAGTFSYSQEGPTFRNNRVNGSALPPNNQFRGTVVKAFATNGIVNTPVFTNTYFVDANISATYGAPMVSISLPTKNFVDFNQQGIYFNPPGSEWYTESKPKTDAYIEIFESNGTRVASERGQVSMNGNGSLGYGQKSLRLYLDEKGLGYDIFKGEALSSKGKPLTAYDRLLLRNSGNDSPYTKIRDAYMHRISKTLNIDIQASRPALAFVNGEFWGSYNLRERYDNKYFQRHYGVDPANLVMIEAPSPLCNGMRGDTPYEVSEGPADAIKPWEDLCNYAETQNLALDANFKRIENEIDLNSFIDYYIATLYVCNTDWPSNNIKVWRNTNPQDPSGLDLKWRFVFCDNDFGFGFPGSTDKNTNLLKHVNNRGTILSKLMSNLMKNEAFKNRFVTRFMEVLDTVYQPDKMTAELDKMAAEMRKIVDIGFKRWPSDGGYLSRFDSEIAVMREFAQERTKIVRQQVTDYFRVGNSAVTFLNNKGEGTMKVDGVVLNDAVTSKNYSLGTSVRIEVKPASGYQYLGTSVISSSGIQTYHPEASFTLKTAPGTTIKALYRKNGAAKVTPQLLAGPEYLIAKNGAGDLYFWGKNHIGQAGIDTWNNSIPKPALLAANVAYAATSNGGISYDTRSTMLITREGELYNAGSNNLRELGRGGEPSVFQKVDLPGKAVQAAAGLDHSLVVLENGDLYGAGSNSNGQLGPQQVGNMLINYTKIASNVSMAAAGRRQTLYLTKEGEVYALGDNRWGKIAHGNGSSVISQPVKIYSGAKFIACCGHNNFLITKDNKLYYFGYKDAADSFTDQKGNGEFLFVMDNVKDVSMQDTHALILTLDGKVYGIGPNSSSQLAGSAESLYNTKNPVYITDKAADVAAGTNYSAVLLTGGTVKVWGSNTAGVFGNSSMSGVLPFSQAATPLTLN